MECCPSDLIQCCIPDSLRQIKETTLKLVDTHDCIACEIQQDLTRIDGALAKSLVVSDESLDIFWKHYLSVQLPEVYNLRQQVLGLCAAFEVVEEAVANALRLRTDGGEIELCESRSRDGLVVDVHRFAGEVNALSIEEKVLSFGCILLTVRSRIRENKDVPMMFGEICGDTSRGFSANHKKAVEIGELNT